MKKKRNKAGVLRPKKMASHGITGWLQEAKGKRKVTVIKGRAIEQAITDKNGSIPLVTRWGRGWSMGLGKKGKSGPVNGRSVLEDGSGGKLRWSHLCKNHGAQSTNAASGE